MTWFRRKPRHHHDWVEPGYGGCGWAYFECSTCGKAEIG